MVKSRVSFKVNTKSKESKGIEIKYQHFMQAYRNIKLFKPTLTDLLLMSILVYLIKPQNQKEQHVKMFFVEFSHKILGIASGLLLFILMSTGSQFNFEYTTIAFAISLITMLSPIIVYELVQKEYSINSIFQNFNSIRDNTALVINL